MKLLFVLAFAAIAGFATSEYLLLQLNTQWRWQWPPRGNLTVNLIDNDGKRHDDVGGTRRYPEWFNWGPKRFWLKSPVNITEVAQVGLLWSSVIPNDNVTAVYTYAVSLWQPRQKEMKRPNLISGLMDKLDWVRGFFAPAHSRRFAIYTRNWTLPGIQSDEEALFNRRHCHRGMDYDKNFC